jgi:hypothetical protein
VNVHHVLVPTLAIAATWLVVALVLAGCGFLTRRLLLAAFAGSRAERLAAADLWLGLAALLAYLQLWSLVLSISWYAWIAPAAIGIAGLVLGGRGLLSLRGARISIPVIALTIVLTLWLANRALALAQDYDLGLYHLNTIGYALRYPAIPGLGNLHDRLGSGDAHLLLVALLEHGKWSRDGFHLANGLLVSMLLLDIASRVLVRPAVPRPPSFTRRTALLLVPATVAVVGISTGYRLASPNLDLAAYVLVAVGALYLAGCIESGFDPQAAATSTAAFAAAAATRPLQWLPTLLALMLVLVAARSRGRRPLGRSALLAGLLPALLAVGWMTRQAVLSGYPLFPVTFVSLPVDWRMSHGVVHAMSALVTSWSRIPGDAPNQVGGFSHWFPTWWHAQVRSLDVMLGVGLLVCLIPALSCRSQADRRERAVRLAPMLAVLTVTVPTLIVWFVVAPDARFVWALFWLIPIALAAWALPSTPGRLSIAMIVLTVVVWRLLVALGLRNIDWLFLAAFDAWAVATVVMRFGFPRRSRAALAQVSLISIAFVPVGILWHQSAFARVVANQDGQFGIPREQATDVTTFVTTSGLQLSTPLGLEDRCFRLLLCTPQQNPALRLRGDGIRSGFTVSPRASGT